MNRRWWTVAVVAVVLVVAATLAARLASAQQADKRVSGRSAAMFIIPEEDRFTPYVLRVHDGDKITIVNKDEDAHTVVSDDAVSTTGPRGLNMIIPAAADDDHPGKVSFRVGPPGTLVIYCRFHSHLDAHSQPVAPGPDGGIQDEHGNFGTPMTAVIQVVANDGNGNG